MKELKEITTAFLAGLISIGGLSLILSEETPFHHRQIEIVEPVVIQNEETSPVKQRPLNDGPDVVIAIIDTGCDLTHPLLKESIWSNPGESGLDDFGRNKAFNGVDDDGNGYVDDAHGWDFTSNSPVLMDEHGHGTHVAGIVAQVSASPRVRLMILKYFDKDNEGLTHLNLSLSALRYAIENGARIINYSGGGHLYSPHEKALLELAAAKGITLVAAAGNDGLNNDFVPFYPATYALPNIISVAAVDEQGRLTANSNYGLVTVDVAAPGHNVLSSLPGQQRGYLSGTSQAAAFVSGLAAALVTASDSQLTPDELLSMIMSHAQAEATQIQTDPLPVRARSALLGPPHFTRRNLAGGFPYKKSRN